MRERRADPHAVVPDAEPRSYYDQPVLKQPVWTWEVPAYFFAGGLAGASSVLAVAARAVGDEAVARAAERAAAAGAAVSPLLLISDLGTPSRFANMLRVLKPTSPMSVGSWVLAAYAPAAVGAELLTELDLLPGVRRLSGVVAAALGPALATYTAVLLADTAVPTWHEARRELPFAFAGGALQSAGAVGVLAAPPAEAATARRVLAGGSLLRAVALRAMDRRLVETRGPAVHGTRAVSLASVSRRLSAGGLALGLTVGRRSRLGAAVAGALSLAGACCERYAVVEAGRESAADPAATVGPQRRRADARSDAGSEHPYRSSAR